MFRGRLVSFVYPKALEPGEQLSCGRLISYHCLMFQVILVACICLALLIVILASISRHKKSASGEVRLIGATALVDSDLHPDGTVLVRGELWRARSSEGTSIAVNSLVRVVAVEDHLLIVETRD